MHKYEFAHIIECEGKSDEDTQAVIGKVRELIADFGGRIVKEDVWGKKELSYPIKKQNFGFYMFTIMMLEPNKLMDFEKKMHLLEGSLRYLIINLDNESGYAIQQIISSKKKAEDKRLAEEANEEIDEETSQDEEESEVEEDADEEDEEEKVESEAKPKAKKVAKTKEDKPVKKATTKKTVTKKSTKKDEAPKKSEKSPEDLDKLLDEKLNELL